MEKTLTFRVRYSETDQMGSYYHGRVLDWFEHGRTELSREMGLAYAEWEDRGIYLPVVETSIRFRGRAGYDELLEMSVSAERVGNVRIRFLHTITHAETKAPVCEGWTLHAIVDHEGRPCRIPEWIAELL